MNLLIRHLQVCLAVIGQLSRNWLNTVLAAAVIGIALALPAGLYLLLHGLDQVTDGWDGSPQISLFLEHGLGADQAAQLVDELDSWPEVGSVSYLSPEQALAEFKDRSGFAAALELLDENPLPGVILLRPGPANMDPGLLQRLADRALAKPGIETAQLDLAWVQRLYSLLQLGNRGTLLLGLLFGAGVVLVTGNTIRLAILNRRDEVEICKLIGATNAFIRRPFVYFGFLQGLCGGVVAVLLVRGGILLLQNPLRELSRLYGTTSGGPGIGLDLSLLLIGALLGLGGAWLAVGRHLRDIEPR